MMNRVGSRILSHVVLYRLVSECCTRMVRAAPTRVVVNKNNICTCLLHGWFFGWKLRWRPNRTKNWSLAVETRWWTRMEFRTARTAKNPPSPSKRKNKAGGGQPCIPVTGWFIVFSDGCWRTGKRRFNICNQCPLPVNLGISFPELSLPLNQCPPIYE